MRKILLATTIIAVCGAMPVHASTIYPWMVKPQTELTQAECKAAMRHDSNYWWARGSCHMKFIRYALGVVTTDTGAQEAPDAIMKKGAILTAITQYRSNDGTYCEHGGYCYPAKNVKLLGSILTGPYGDDDGDQSVSASCETMLADRANILAAGAIDQMRGCH